MGRPGRGSRSRGPRPRSPPRRGGAGGRPVVVARGEIWWHEAPDESRRPYLVLTRDAGIPVLNQLLAVPVTRTIRGIPTEVRLDEVDGLPAECVLTLDNL